MRLRNYIHREKKAHKPLHTPPLNLVKHVFSERLLSSESGRSARDIDIRKLGTLDIGVYTQHSNENKEVSTISALIRIIKKQLIWLPT